MYTFNFKHYHQTYVIYIYIEIYDFCSTYLISCGLINKCVFNNNSICSFFLQRTHIKKNLHCSFWLTSCFILCRDLFSRKSVTLDTFNYLSLSNFVNNLLQFTMHCMRNNRPMGHIAHLRKQFKSINTYNYIITLINRRKKPLS